MPLVYRLCLHVHIFYFYTRIPCKKFLAKRTSNLAWHKIATGEKTGVKPKRRNVLANSTNAIGAVR